VIACRVEKSSKKRDFYAAAQKFADNSVGGLRLSR
jgi:hypothetical protein